VALIALAGVAAACAGGGAPDARPPQDVWRAAAARGVDFRAIGQEPGWLLEIDEGRSLRLLYDYGQRSVTMTAPAAVTVAGRRTYTARDAADRLQVIIEAAPCQDTMSGEPFPDTVRVTVNDLELRGCGRPLRP
jgi:putative lipoprotein